MSVVGHARKCPRHHTPCTDTHFIMLTYARASTFLAAGAYSVVFAYACTTTLLALITLPPVFAPPTNPHLLGLGLRPVMASVLLTVVQQQLLASPNRFARIQQHFGSIVVERMRASIITVWIAAVPTPVQHYHRRCRFKTYQTQSTL